MTSKEDLIPLLKEKVEWYCEEQGVVKPVFSLERFSVHKFLLIERVLQKVHAADGPVFTPVNNKSKRLEERVSAN